MAERLVISIDAMGGDNAPDAIIEGVKIASDKNPEVFFLLFGDEDEISKLARQNQLNEKCYKIYHTDQVIRPDEKPSAAVRYGRESSMWKAIFAVRTGEASAVVSAGFSLGRLAAFITSATITIIAVNANIRKNIIHLPSACNPFSLKLLLLISNFSPDS